MRSSHRDTARIFLAFTGVLLLFASTIVRVEAAGAVNRKPNILVILADDLGYADIPAHGGQGLSMPNLEELTRHGVRFSNGYVTSPQCSPSRCGLLTGIYNQRFGHEHNGCMQAAFDAGAKTLAEHLRPAGYATAAYGKWHLGDGLESHHPTRHGFDEAWGYGDYAKASKQGLAGFPVSLRPAGGNHAQNYGTRAAGFIEAHAAQPWFVYAAFHEPHVPVVPTAHSASATDGATPDPLRRKCLGVLRDLDGGVGIILAKLRDLHLEEHTLIVFLSDNGAPHEEALSAPDGGERKPKAKAGRKDEDDPAANGSSNAPLRGRKGTMWEGGIRVPFVLTWKGTLPAGRIYDHPVISLDVAATALAAAGTNPLAGTALDGVNLLPFLTGESTAAPHERLFWRYADRELFAVREGNWKLVQSKTPAPQLFDLGVDGGERHDLAARHPDIVKRLHTAWDEWNATLKPPVIDEFSSK